MAKPGPSDFGRVSMHGGIVIGDETDAQKKQRRIDQTPEDRFTEYVGAIASNLREKQVINISQEEVDNVLLSPARMETIKLEYLNPTAYILGYLIVEDNRINKNKLKGLLPQLDNLTSKVSPADLIRYARFWMM